MHLSKIDLLTDLVQTWHDRNCQMTEKNMYSATFYGLHSQEEQKRKKVFEACLLTHVDICVDLDFSLM